jgi:hypothetical protein
MTRSEIQQRWAQQAAEKTGSGDDSARGPFVGIFHVVLAVSNRNTASDRGGGRVSRGWQHGRSSMGRCAGVAVAVLQSLADFVGGKAESLLCCHGRDREAKGVGNGVLGRADAARARIRGGSVNFSEVKCQERGACGRTLVAGSGIVFGG